MTHTPPPPGTIQVWSDPLCPFTAVALHRLRAARLRHGIELQLDHHVFALKLFNGPHPRRGVAEKVGLDTRALADTLDGGRHRRQLFDDHVIAQTDAIGGSPTFVLPDGFAVTKPGIDVHWQGEWAVSFPVIDRSDPAEVEDLVHRAAA
jgi:predicted DsbA family dithiol-disulfide isomerase